MFEIDVKVIEQFTKLAKSSERAGFRNLGHAAATISRHAKDSILRSHVPSAPGNPPHTRGKPGKNLKSAVQFFASEDEAIVGPVASQVDDLGALHEFGKSRGYTIYPARPFMGPALESNVDRFLEEWEHSFEE